MTIHVGPNLALSEIMVGWANVYTERSVKVDFTLSRSSWFRCCFRVVDNIDRQGTCPAIQLAKTIKQVVDFMERVVNSSLCALLMKP